MRAMIAIGIVLSATTGRIRCRTTSLSSFQSPVTRELKMKWLAMKFMACAVAVPAWTVQPQTS